MFKKKFSLLFLFLLVCSSATLPLSGVIGQKQNSSTSRSLIKKPKSVKKGAGSIFKKKYLNVGFSLAAAILFSVYLWRRSPGVNDNVGSEVPAGNDNVRYYYSNIFNKEEDNNKKRAIYYEARTKDASQKKVKIITVIPYDLGNNEGGFIEKGAVSKGKYEELLSKQVDIFNKIFRCAEEQKCKKVVLCAFGCDIYAPEIKNGKRFIKKMYVKALERSLKNRSGYEISIMSRYAKTMDAVVPGIENVIKNAGCTLGRLLGEIDALLVDVYVDEETLLVNAGSNDMGPGDGGGTNGEFGIHTTLQDVQRLLTKSYIPTTSLTQELNL